MASASWQWKYWEGRGLSSSHIIWLEEEDEEEEEKK